MANRHHGRIVRRLSTDLMLLISWTASVEAPDESQNLEWALTASLDDYLDGNVVVREEMTSWRWKLVL